MSYLLPINLNHYKKKIKDRTTFLIDSSSQEIPDDPLFSCYEDSEEIRLISKETLETFQKNLDEVRKLIQRHGSDGSQISIALEALGESDDLSLLQQKYKEILLKKTGQNIMAIRQFCLFMDVLVFSARTTPYFFDTIFSQNSPVLHDEIIEIVILANQTPTHYMSLSDFLTLLQIHQESLIQENRKKLLHNGEALGETTVVCPYTRKKISVSASLETADVAKDFLAIFVALYTLADLPFSELKAHESKDYLYQAQETLLRYLKNPTVFTFTETQRKFLDELGINDVKNQLNQLAVHNRLNCQPVYNRYNHLWENQANEETTIEENALKLLIDYNKQNWILPSVGLFFTGHWRRHHYGIVAKAIERLQRGDDLQSTLEELETAARIHPQFNEEGSLINRLNCIRYHYQEKAAFAASMEDEVPSLNTFGGS
ncbi:DUF5617 domain-containing protein [Legionella hackeliae]|uniref:RavJ-like C-terminal domain-containing protein n=1 Tax=Legionella hackeliae TaxID=449 RepID=A0A0A8UQP1_LEGHA|nr:DUF5617 domain-containing protein [Legionella hackeliae]KTD15479.1 hypothetical protein Lhac_0321 [Legionella hackeliae]CEK11150.1 protein of unknown function [Legionella hackeliae]STX47908.1 Uncharacterised protein [Legionella hackeliae]